MKQLEFRTWGGRRKGAGRPAGKRPIVLHRARPVLKKRFPVHVTMRMAANVYNLRSRRSFRVIEQAFLKGGDRFGFRLIHFTVQGNHLHLIAEAENERSLSSGVRGLSIRIARGLNKMMGRHGQVIAERYHFRALETPTELRNAVHYVLNNHHHHNTGAHPRDPFSSAANPTLVVRPNRYLFRLAFDPAMRSRPRTT